MASTRPKVIAVIGTTASGKSDLALSLAHKYKGIIIAADARTLYQGLDIGTAKPTKTEQRVVPHFMIDVITPRQIFTAQKFQKMVYGLVTEHSDQPIFLVGGNGLYVDAILKGLNFGGTKPGKQLRAKLDKANLQQLKIKLKKIDPLAYSKVDLSNKRRIVRALEVKITSGKSLFELSTSRPPAWDILKLGLTTDRKILRQRIEQRVKKMWQRGWVAEVKKLINKYSKNSPGFSSHGYPEIICYLAGQCTKEQAQQKIIHNVWTYSKRQLNWFKKDPQIIWLKPTSKTKADQLVSQFLQQ